MASGAWAKAALVRAAACAGVGARAACPPSESDRSAQRRERRRRAVADASQFRGLYLRHRGGRRHTSQAQHEHTPRKVSHTAPLMPSRPPGARGVSVSGATVPQAPEIHVRPRRSEGVTAARRARAILAPLGRTPAKTVFLPATELLRSGPSNARGEAPTSLLETSRTADSPKYLTPRFHRVEVDRALGSFGRPGQAAPP